MFYRHYSHYAERACAARPELPALIEALAALPLTRARIEARLDALCHAAMGTPEGHVSVLTDDHLKKALRQLRTEVFCAVMERDLCGAADLAEVTGTMTDLAETVIQRALAIVIADLQTRFGEPRGSQHQPLTLGVVGMGKLGGRELNVSSDIDLIFVYEDDGETTGGERAPIATQDFFTRAGKRLIAMLNDVTDDGYVFRVDMRLRPNGDSGPLVCSLDMLEEYFYVQGREWERYAWIKGRLVSEGDSAAAQRLAVQLETLVKPFIWRRYLDFGVIEAIRSLHVQIRHEAQRRATMRPDKADDIKLGRGGIREIEFSAQSYQLIRGGQDAGFRVKPTLTALHHAVNACLLASPAYASLERAYCFLRALEHRLQYRDDAQTHSIPVDAAERAALAQAMGYGDYATLAAALNAHRDAVEQQFTQIFADKSSKTASHHGHGRDNDTDGGAAAWLWSEMLAEDGDDALLARLAELGVETHADVLLTRLRGLWHSARYAALPERNHQRFDALARRTLEATRTLQPPEKRAATLARMFDLLEAIGGRGAYLSLLTEYPDALARVLTVLGASRWATDYLMRHPQLLDELLDDDALDAQPDWPAFRHRLHERLIAADDAEQQMDLLRHAHHAETFRVLLADLAGKLTVEQIGDRLSDLADAMLDATLETVWRQFPKRHRDAPRFSIIAYGKLGGKELGYASDLDLIFLYDDTDDNAPEIYSAFTRRLISWLTTATGAGTLFDIDLRLRPNGESGLLVTDLDSFRRYQLREGDAANTAWVWEHQALTRARFCAGDARIGAQFEAIRAQVLTTPREAATLAQEIIDMRQRVEDGHPNPTDLFDLKHDRGGMVDIEFLVQYWVLLHAARNPELIRNTGNIALLREVSRFGLMSEDEALTIGAAYRAYRKLQHQLRLDGMDKARVEPARVAVQRDAVRRLWERVFAKKG